MSTIRYFSGVYAFNVTPSLNDGESIDEVGLRRYIDYQIEAGVDGLTFFGSTGGIGLFTEEERKKVAKIAVEQAAGRVPVIFGIGALSTSESVRLAEFSEKIGVDGVLVVPISYWKPTTSELFEHYRNIAAASSLPLIVYNNPATTGIDITPDLLSRLSELDTIYHVKDSSGDISRPTLIRQMTGDRMLVWNGCDLAAPQSFAGGAKGWGAGTASMVPHLCKTLYKLCVERNDYVAASSYFARMLPLIQLMHAEGYIRVAHSALDLMGRSAGLPRRPIRPLTEKSLGALSSILRDLDQLPRDGLQKRPRPCMIV